MSAAADEERAPAASQQTPTARLRITGGGTPTPAELAAVSVALQAIAAATRPTSAAGHVAAWRRAGVLEGTTDVRIADRAALDVHGT